MDHWQNQIEQKGLNSPSIVIGFYLNIGYVLGRENA